MTHQYMRGAALLLSLYGVLAATTVFASMI